MAMGRHEESQRDRDELASIASRYATFAAHEAEGASQIYASLARAIAGSTELIGFLGTLPQDRRQPNLFLAVVRHLFGVPDGEQELIDFVRREPLRIRELMLSRTTQTNEPARCAVLLPLLARLPQPLALLEVGASAGLCLLPDRYGYDYGTARLLPRRGDGGPPPLFECRVRGVPPLPRALPRVVWRCGLDLNPIDVRVSAETAWLETLVWPGQEKRLDQLRSAIRLAAAEPPPIRKGSLITDLAPVMAQAPADATLVVFHSAVLAYVSDEADRERFAGEMMRAKAVWISNEPPAVFARMAHSAPPPSRPGLFLLALDGEAVAWTGPHGQSLEWFAS
jgi:hypothetical protein